MSELRNRSGAQSSAMVSASDSYTVTSKGKGEAIDIRIMKPVLYMGGGKHFKEEEIEDIIRSSVLPRNKVKQPSTSNTAQEAKDALEEDPYNINKIVKLGYIYCSEFQYDKAANVMIRGWKRASELKTAEERFTFLMKLAEVSFRDRTYRQAHAIIMDIDEPQDYYDKKAYQLLTIHIYAEINDAPKALATFSKAIEGEEFEGAIKIWAACALRLKKVGAFEAAKNAVMNKARSGQNYHMDQSRMQTVESWAIMSGGDKAQKGWFNLDDGIQDWMKKAAIGFVIFLFVWFLWWAESRSLRALKLG